MKNKNICKFTPIDEINDLFTSCFVLETNESVMKTKTRLKYNRAVLVEKGEGDFLIDNTLYSFGCGSLVFVFEGETFCVENGNDVSYLYIDFNGSKGNNLLKRFGIFPSTRKTKNFSELLPIWKESLLSSTQENIDITAESMLLYMFSRLSSSSKKENEIFQKIIEFTQENFSNCDLSISLIAQNLGYNAKYLSHFFKTKMNLNYNEYLRSIRLKYAISLFENGLSSIKNVAFLSGFSDPLYFSSVFKKEIGLSPKTFVESIKNNTN